MNRVYNIYRDTCYNLDFNKLETDKEVETSCFYFLVGFKQLHLKIP